MLVAMKTESKVVEVTLHHVGHIGLRCTDHVSRLIADDAGGQTDQIEYALGMILILRALSVEEKTFARLAGMCSVGMCDVL